jgi:hypothetical protein
LPDEASDPTCHGIGLRDAFWNLCEGVVALLAKKHNLDGVIIGHAQGGSVTL